MGAQEHRNVAAPDHAGENSVTRLFSNHFRNNGQSCILTMQQVEGRVGGVASQEKKHKSSSKVFWRSPSHSALFLDIMGPKPSQGSIPTPNPKFPRRQASHRRGADSDQGASSCLLAPCTWEDLTWGLLKLRDDSTLGASACHNHDWEA